tara:strand:- start:220 stop:684 length:465 start_codon:yes stop_codon:yes gene_type:complete
MQKFKDWLHDTATIMFREDRNDFRSLPKSTRLSILLQLSFIWSCVFSIYVFQFETMALGFASVMLAHILLIFAVYWTFKQFGRSKVKDPSLQVEVKEESYSMPKLMIFCLIVFIVFIFTRGLMVLDQNENSYSIPYQGPDTTTMERIERFFLRK